MCSYIFSLIICHHLRCNLIRQLKHLRKFVTKVEHSCFTFSSNYTENAYKPYIRSFELVLTTRSTFLTSLDASGQSSVPWQHSKKNKTVVTSSSDPQNSTARLERQECPYAICTSLQLLHCQQADQPAAAAGSTWLPCSVWKPDLFVTYKSENIIPAVCMVPAGPRTWNIVPASLKERTDIRSHPEKQRMLRTSKNKLKYGRPLFSLGRNILSEE